ncbi:ubiquinone biosynthesis accessory factor UbiJ [Chitinimonas taiwanensis]|uniref:ubiquinone biosynthesis accessory factor UbiJ n=1 Tax=Chitinimonas taiwanensis TaxID=240412 RepID=UPI0035B15411
MLRLALLNHLLHQRADLRAELQSCAGRTARLSIPPFRLNFQIGTDGFLLAGEGEPEASITIPPWLLPRLALHDPAAERELQIVGDTQLAATLGRVLQALDWDAEADLARLLGDIPAHRLAESARNLIGDPRHIARNLAESTAEYLQEEARLLVARPSVAHFVAEVDRLRDDAARLAKRLQRLEKPEH